MTDRKRTTRRSSASKKGGTGGKRGFYRGAAGRNNVDKEIDRQKQRREAAEAQGRMPFRFWIKPGETREIVILDEEPDFFRYEHNIQDERGKWSLFPGCVKDWDNCPICEATNKESAYVLFLSIIDLTPFTGRDGTEHEFSRKLMPIKVGMQKKFLRKFLKIKSLRGQVVEMTRDSNKDPQIGGDLEWVDEMDEDELSEYTRSYKDRDGKTHTEDCSVVFDYEELFDEPEVDELIKLVPGYEPPPGSSKSNRRTLEEEEVDEDEEDDVPFDQDEEEKPSRKHRGTRAKRDEDEEEKPRNSRSRRSSKDEDEEEEEKPRRSPRRNRSRDEDEDEEKPRRSSRRRKARDDDDGNDDDEDERPARRSRRSRR